MAHPLVEQLRFTRSEWLRGLKGVPEADGVRRLKPMNSIGWIVGNGGPATTPPLAEMLEAWRTVAS